MTGHFLLAVSNRTISAYPIATTADIKTRASDD